MFVSNPSNWQPKDRETGKSERRKPKTRFENVEQFSKWLEIELAKLVNEYAGFETTTSRKGHFGR